MTDNESWAERLTLPTKDGGFVLISEVAAVTGRGSEGGYAWLKGSQQGLFRLAIDADTARERIVAFHAPPDLLAGLAKEKSYPFVPTLDLDDFKDELVEQFTPAPTPADPEDLTAEGLDALPEGSLVLDRDEGLWRRVGNGWMITDVDPLMATPSAHLAEEHGPIRLVKWADD